MRDKDEGEDDINAVGDSRQYNLKGSKICTNVMVMKIKVADTYKRVPYKRDQQKMCIYVTLKII